VHSLGWDSNGFHFLSFRLLLVGYIWDRREKAA
jgi:hypothetical protein